MFPNGKIGNLFFLKELSTQFDTIESIYGTGANLEWNTEKNNSGVLKLN
jgi:hypothetical protein